MLENGKHKEREIQLLRQELDLRDQQCQGAGGAAEQPNKEIAAPAGKNLMIRIFSP